MTVDRFDRHNEEQRRYYTRTERSTIAAGETPYVRRHLEEVLRIAEVAPGASVLDAGCGRGRHAFALAQRGYRVEGLELSPDLLACLRAEDRFGIPVHCGDLAQPPAELAGRFDAVLGFFILHHLLDLKAAFSGIAEMARSGGRIVFIEPNPANLLYSVQITFTPHMSWSAEKGIFNMRRGQIFQAMAQAGLADPQVYRFGFLPPFLRNTRWGGSVDAMAERIGVLEPVLPFQVFSARKL